MCATASDTATLPADSACRVVADASHTISVVSGREPARLGTSAGGCRALGVRRTKNWAQLAKFCVVGGVGYVDQPRACTRRCSGPARTTSLPRHLLPRRGHEQLHPGTASGPSANGADNIAEQGFRFLVVLVGSLGVNLVVLHLFLTFGGGKFVAQAVAIVLVTPLNFLGNKLWSFRPL